MFFVMRHGMTSFTGVPFGRIAVAEKAAKSASLQSFDRAGRREVGRRRPVRCAAEIVPPASDGAVASLAAHARDVLAVVRRVRSASRVIADDCA